MYIYIYIHVYTCIYIILYIPLFKQINIPSDLGEGDHEIHFELTMTDKCEQTDMVSWTLNQTLWLSVVGL